MCTREPARGVKSGGPPPDKTNDPEFPAWLRVPPASAPSRSQASFPVSARRSSGTVGQHLPDVRPSVHPRLPSPGFPSSLCLSILPAGGDSGPGVKFRPQQQHFPPRLGAGYSHTLPQPGAPGGAVAVRASAPRRRHDGRCGRHRERSSSPENPAQCPVLGPPLLAAAPRAPSLGNTPRTEGCMPSWGVRWSRVFRGPASTSAPSGQSAPAAEARDGGCGATPWPAAPASV